MHGQKYEKGMRTKNVIPIISFRLFSSLSKNVYLFIYLIVRYEGGRGVRTIVLPEPTEVWTEFG